LSSTWNDNMLFFRKLNLDLNVVKELLGYQFVLCHWLDETSWHRQVLLFHHGFILAIELRIMNTVDSLLRRFSHPGAW